MERTQPSPQPEDPQPRGFTLPSHGRATSSVDEQVRTWLGEIADRLERNRPAAQLTAVARIAVLQATTLDPVLGRALRIAAPEVDDATPITRRAYAARLREIAGAAR